MLDAWSREALAFDFNRLRRRDFTWARQSAPSQVHCKTGSALLAGSFLFRGTQCNTLHLKVTLPDVGRSGAVLYHLCVVILSQPRRQLPLYLFAFVDTNLCRHRGPPIRNTSITDGLATVEESTGVGPLKELPAPGTAANTKQGQCTN